MSEPTVEPSSAVPTVLVTGGTGFLGGWCIVALLRRLPGPDHRS